MIIPKPIGSLLLLSVKPNKNYSKTSEKKHILSLTFTCAQSIASDLHIASTLATAASSNIYVSTGHCKRRAMLYVMFTIYLPF